jgi:regulator of RNase E activity RraA
MLPRLANTAGSGDGRPREDTTIDDAAPSFAEALDDLKPNEVYVAAAGQPPYALWGELMSTRARHRG